MTFTELAQEVLYRCGEGYQDYLDRAKAHLVKNFELLMLSSEMKETDYYGMIREVEFTTPENPLSVLDIFDEESERSVGMLRFMYLQRANASLQVEKYKLDMITNDEYSNYSKISDFIERYSYYMSESNFNFVTDFSLNDRLYFTYLKRYEQQSVETDLVDLFSDNFISKSIDLTVQSLYKEINS